MILDSDYADAASVEHSDRLPGTHTNANLISAFLARCRPPGFHHDRRDVDWRHLFPNHLPRWNE
jgi:hypothetical protein